MPRELSHIEAELKAAQANHDEEAKELLSARAEIDARLAEMHKPVQALKDEHAAALKKDQRGHFGEKHEAVGNKCAHNMHDGVCFYCGRTSAEIATGKSLKQLREDKEAAELAAKLAAGKAKLELEA